MANKKINQLVAKTTIQSTDLFPLGDPTTGQLFKKTVAELQAAIGGAVISVNGLTGVVVLDTDDVQELASPTNRYFTEARSRAAINLTTTGSSGASTYSSSTGVLNVPNYTLAGLGGIGASFLSGGTGITYNSSTGVISYSGTVYTDSSIRALFSAGTGISYNSSTGAISYSGTVYTDSSIRALISLTTTGSSGAATYNNTTGVINVPNYTLAGLGGISATFLSATTPISYNSSTGVISISQSNSTTSGFLSSTDWNTFNGKQSALTIGNLTEATSSVLTITGGTGAIIGSGTSIQVKQASSTVSGFLSSTDWSTFNSKQNALTNPVTGTGTSGYHAKWTSGTAIGNGIIYDDGNQIGINVTPPTWYSNFKGLNLPNGSFIGYSTNGSIFLSQNLYFNAAGSWTFINTGTGGQHSIDGSGNHTFSTAASGSAGAAATLVERMRITSAGSIGINATGYSSTKLLVRGGDSTSSNWGLIVEDSGTNQIFGIRNDGKVGIGTGSPTGKLQINNTSTQYLVYDGSGNLQVWQPESTASGTQVRLGSAYNLQGVYSNGLLNLISDGSSAIAFCTGGYIERARFTNGGNLLLGTTTDNGERLYVSGSIRATGSITANSDARLKKNIERIENALEKVEQISGYTYNTIYDEDRHAGVIAQEIDKVLPEIVNKGNDGLMGVEYGNISALLIEAIKDLKTQNDSLQARLSALEK